MVEQEMGQSQKNWAEYAIQSRTSGVLQCAGNAIQSRTSGVYSSAVDYADEKGLLSDIVVFCYYG